MPVINIINGVIQDISGEGVTSFVTVSYRSGQGDRRGEQTVRLVVGPRTVIVNSNGLPLPLSFLRQGMLINATISSAMTRSNPPQAAAYIIRVVRRPGPQPGPGPRPQPGPRPENVTVGVILEVDRNNRSFTTISNRDFSTIIRFNVPNNAVILDRNGRPINFSRLTQGIRVRVRHASFMTASIPPQTTAFEIRVL
ncbi:MAG: hypothetical protein IKK59_08560 [Lachnospiraceae bacterium]|nr:hypothetical protein [Lachnospiraceae bacterium]